MRNLYESIFTIGNNETAKHTVIVARMTDIRNNADEIFPMHSSNPIRKSMDSEENMYISDDDVLNIAHLEYTESARLYMNLSKKVRDIFNKDVIRGISFSRQRRKIGYCNIMVQDDLDMKTSEGRFEIVNPPKNGIDELNIVSANMDDFCTLKNLDLIGEPVNILHIHQARLEDCALNCKKMDIVLYNATYPIFSNCHLTSSSDLNIIMYCDTEADAGNGMSILDWKHNPKKDLLDYMGITPDKNIKNFRLQVVHNRSTVLWLDTSYNNTSMDYAGEFPVDDISKKVHVWYKEI